MERTREKPTPTILNVSTISLSVSASFPSVVRTRASCCFRVSVAVIRFSLEQAAGAMPRRPPLPAPPQREARGLPTLLGTIGWPLAAVR